MVDTSTVENGSFKFADDLKYPEQISQVEDQKDNFVLIAEKGIITVTLYKDSFTPMKGTVQMTILLPIEKKQKTLFRQ